MTMKKAKWAAIALMMAMTVGVVLTACSSSDNDDAVKPERIVTESIDVETLQSPREVTQLQHKKEEFLSNGNNQVLRSVGLTPFYVEKKNENGQNLITSLVAKGDLSKNKEGYLVGKYRIESPDLFVSDIYQELDAPVTPTITIKMKDGYEVGTLVNDYPQYLKLLRSNILGYHDVYCDVINSHELFKFINLLQRREDTEMVSPCIIEMIDCPDSAIVLPTNSAWMDQIIGAKWKFYGFGTFDYQDIRKLNSDIDCETCFVITFGEDGKFSGTTSANEFSGDYTMSVDGLTILQPVCTTKVYEIGDGNEFFESFQACTHYVISDEQLLLYYNHNKNFLVFNQLSE